MPKANFFIVGAPKCGTTALSQYLRNHQQIYMTTPKEPGFFSEDLPGLRYVQSLDEYDRLYRLASLTGFPARGEASPSYLRSRVAIERIREYNPAAKLIVMLRNPLEMLLSYHAQLVFSLYEDQTDFDTAWRLQSERAAGRCIPARCREPGLLRYREIALLGDQLERVYRVFPREQVLVVLHDEFRRDTRAVYEKALAFLGLPSDGRTDFPAVNRAKIARWAWLNRLLHTPPDWALDLLRKLSGSRLHNLAVSVHGRLNALNSIARRPTLPGLLVRQELVAILRPQAEKLELLLGIKLPHWMETMSVQLLQGQQEKN